MISDLELRHIVESGFLPMKCACTLDPMRSMTIQIIDEKTGKELFTVTGIDASSLSSMRAISALVLEVKEDMKLMSLAPSRRSWSSRA